jgi:hypothetical protein
VYRGAKDAVRLCMGKNGLVAGRLGGRNEKAVRLDEVAEVEMVAMRTMWHFQCLGRVFAEREGKISDHGNGQCVYMRPK